MDTRPYTAKIARRNERGGGLTRCFAVTVANRFKRAAAEMTAESGTAWDATGGGNGTSTLFIRTADGISADDIREAVWEYTGGVGAVTVDALDADWYEEHLL